MMQNPTVPQQDHPAVIRFLANLLSYVFHPLFIPAYVTAYLVLIDPYAFIALPEKFKWLKLISVFFNTAFIPGFAVFLMWRLKLINSMMLRTQKERIIPYAAAMVCYFWAWYVSHNQPDNPDYFVNFLLGVFLALCGAWLANIYMKISMHATGMGGLGMFFLLRAFSLYDASGFYFSIALLIAGLVCTARFIVSDHRAAEIYTGFVIGAVSQLIGVWLG